jgi:hypothetical protein
VIERTDEGFYWVNGRPYTGEQFEIVEVCEVKTDIITHRDARLIIEFYPQYKTRLHKYVNQQEAQSKRLVKVEELLGLKTKRLELLESSQYVNRYLMSYDVKYITKMQDLDLQIKQLEEELK